MNKKLIGSFVLAALSPCAFSMVLSESIHSAVGDMKNMKLVQASNLTATEIETPAEKSPDNIEKITPAPNTKTPNTSAEKSNQSKSEKKAEKSEDENPIGEDSTLFLEYAISLKKGKDIIYEGTVIIPDNVDYSLGARADGEQYSGQKLTKKPQGGWIDVEKTQRSQGWTLELNGSKEIGTGNIVSSIVFETFLQLNPLAVAVIPPNKDSKKENKKPNINPSGPVTPILPDKLLPALYVAQQEVQQSATEKIAEIKTAETVKVPEGTLIIGPEGSVVNSRGGTQRIVRAIAQKVGTNGSVNDGDIQLSIKVVAVKPIPKFLLKKKTEKTDTDKTLKK